MTPIDPCIHSTRSPILLLLLDVVTVVGLGVDAAVVEPLGTVLAGAEPVVVVVGVVTGPDDVTVDVDVAVPGELGAVDDSSDSALGTILPPATLGGIMTDVALLAALR